MCVLLTIFPYPAVSHVFQGPGFSVSRFLMVEVFQVFQGPDFSGSKFIMVQVFRVQVFRVRVLGPGPGSRFRVQGPESESRVQGPGFGSRVRPKVWVQVTEVAINM